MKNEKLTVKDILTVPYAPASFAIISCKTGKTHFCSWRNKPSGAVKFYDCEVRGVEAGIRLMSHDATMARSYVELHVAESDLDKVKNAK